MVAETHEDSTAMVTIITDGYENTSREYTYEHVAKMIQELKQLGWIFNFLGANIDVEKVGQSLNIDKENCMSYESTEDGTRSSLSKLNGLVESVGNCQGEYEALNPSCRARRKSRQEEKEQRISSPTKHKESNTNRSIQHEQEGIVRIFMYRA